MATLVMDKELKQQLTEQFRRLDDEMRELEEFCEMMDGKLDELEKRVAGLRRHK